MFAENITSAEVIFWPDLTTVLYTGRTVEWFENNVELSQDIQSFKHPMPVRRCQPDPENTERYERRTEVYNIQEIRKDNLCD